MNESSQSLPFCSKSLQHLGGSDVWEPRPPSEPWWLGCPGASSTIGTLVLGCAGASATIGNLGAWMCESLEHHRHLGTRLCGSLEQHGHLGGSDVREPQTPSVTLLLGCAGASSTIGTLLHGCAGASSTKAKVGPLLVRERRVKKVSPFQTHECRLVAH